MTSRVQTRVQALTRKHGVFQKNVMGAYDTQPLRGAEFLLHEVAHWTVMGNPITKVPRRLSHKLDDFFRCIPTASSDCLEIDTSLVTFVAGCMLGLWTDPTPIIHSCRRNLKGAMALGEDSEVLKCFRNRWLSVSSSYTTHARELALWFRPSAKGRLLSCAFITFGV